MYLTFFFQKHIKPEGTAISRPGGYEMFRLGSKNA